MPILERDTFSANVSLGHISPVYEGYDISALHVSRRSISSCLGSFSILIIVGFGRSRRDFKSANKAERLGQMPILERDTFSANVSLGHISPVYEGYDISISSCLGSFSILIIVGFGRSRRDFKSANKAAITI
jgi:hypothetical protein